MQARGLAGSSERYLMLVELSAVCRVTGPFRCAENQRSSVFWLNLTPFDDKKQMTRSAFPVFKPGNGIKSESGSMSPVSFVNAVRQLWTVNHHIVSQTVVGGMALLYLL